MGMNQNTNNTKEVRLNELQKPISGKKVMLNQQDV